MNPTSQPYNGGPDSAHPSTAGEDNPAPLGAHEALVSQPKPGDDPGEFGIGILPNPKARYWQGRAAFWRNEAIARGYKITEEPDPPRDTWQRELLALADEIDRQARECPTVDWRPNAFETARKLRALTRALSESAGGAPVAWQYRVTAGPQTGWSLWMDGRGDHFKGHGYTVEHRPLYTSPQKPSLSAADTVFVIQRADGTPYHRDDAMGILATDSEAQAIRFAYVREEDGAEVVRYGRVLPDSAPARAPGGEAWQRLETWLGTYADSIPSAAYHELCAIQKVIAAAGGEVERG